jgi:uncharacterized protein YbjT (DUF2867 family)
MKVVLFGSTGMVGQGALRECLLDPDVTSVLAVVRNAELKPHPKLQELVHKDFLDFSPVAEALTGYGACLWCLGITSAGMSEADYTRITYGFTMAAAKVLAERNPGMTFIFISGANTDVNGKAMWARVKGKAEDGVSSLPFKAAYMFRPGFIQPKHGIVSKTKSYRILYALFRPFVPVVKVLMSNKFTTSEILGRAMLAVAKQGAGKTVLESPDINAIGQRTA